MAGVVAEPRGREIERDAARTPECPRCAYDLTGLVATWTHSCPMDAICSECGLNFDCARVFSAILIGPAWSYEHSLARSTRRWWATSLVAMRPPKLCRELGIDHEVRPRRLVRFSVFWLLGLHLAAFSLTFLLGMFTGLGMPNPFFRADWYRFLRAGDGEWRTVIAYLVFPYAGHMSIPTGVSSSVRIPIAPVFMLIYFPIALMPAWLMLLGTSLRMARVRRVHLLRGLCYSIPGGAAWFAIVILCAIGGVKVRVFFGVSTPMILAAALLGWFAYYMVWWYLFIKRYLRLRHAAAVVGLNSVMTVLVLMLSVVMLSLSGIRF